MVAMVLGAMARTITGTVVCSFFLWNESVHKRNEREFGCLRTLSIAIDEVCCQRYAALLEPLHRAKVGLKTMEIQSIPWQYVPLVGET